MPAQWVHLGTAKLLVASSRGAWLQRPQPGALGFVSPMPRSLQGTPETTRHLLDGALAAAERETPVVQALPMTATRWAWQLANQWYCAHHSVALLPEVVRRFDSIRRTDLAGFARRKLEQERGHDRLALADLLALGYDADALAKDVVPAPSVAAGLDYALGCVRGQRPVEFLGYVYALERSAIRVPDEWLSALDAVLPPGADASSATRAHATEFDVEHVAEAISFFAGLPADDRSSIALSCYRITKIRCAPPQDQYPSEAELDRWLSRFKNARVRSVGPSRSEQ